MSAEIRLARAGGIERGAVVGADGLTDAVLEPVAASYLVGGIYRARIRSVLPALKAALIDLGAAGEAWLDAARGREALPPEGGVATVQIVQAAARGKRPRATLRPLLTGRYLALDPAGRGGGLSHRIAGPARTKLGPLIGRLAAGGKGGLFGLHRAAGIDAAILAAEAEALRRRWAEASAGPQAPGSVVLAPPRAFEELMRLHVHADCRRVVADTPRLVEEARRWIAAWAPDWSGSVAEAGPGATLFDDAAMRDDMAAALDVHVDLPSGARLTVEATAALIAIDVDTESASGAAGSGRTLFDRVNGEAIAAIARHIRLRNLAGLVVADLAGIGARTAPAAMAQRMAAAVAGDPMTVEIGGVSKFGLLELSRRRSLPALADMMTRCGL